MYHMLQWAGALSILGAALVFWGKADLKLGGLLLLVISVTAGSGMLMDRRAEVDIVAAAIAWFSGAVVGGGATSAYLGYSASPRSWTAVALGVATILIGYVLPLALFFLGGVR